MPNINWGVLSSSQIREVIRMWPELPEFLKQQPKSKYKPRAKAEHQIKAAVKPQRTEVTKRQKHFGADGEIKFVEHRNLYVGFFGGRVVVTKRTREACAEYLLAVHGIQAAG